MLRKVGHGPVRCRHVLSAPLDALNLYSRGMSVGASAYLPLPARREYLGREAEGAGVRCAEAAYPPGLRIAEHAHEHVCLTVVMGGALQEFRGRRPPLAGEPGTALVRPRAHPHADAISAAGVLDLEIEFHRSFAEDLELARAFDDTAAVQHARVPELAASIRREMRASDTARALVLEGLALELLGVALRASGRDHRAPRPPRWLRELRERLQSGFRDSVRFERLAAEVGVHPVHLARAFRAHYGTTPGAFLRGVRVAWAAEEMRRDPDRPLTEVALAAGFSDHSHFSRVFRSLMGVPPGAWARSSGDLRSLRNG
jgi:AraC family transcriptional regulator